MRAAAMTTTFTLLFALASCGGIAGSNDIKLESEPGLSLQSSAQEVAAYNGRARADLLELHAMMHKMKAHGIGTEREFSYAAGGDTK
jgi:hypothetical protein